MNGHPTRDPHTPSSNESDESDDGETGHDPQDKRFRTNKKKMWDNTNFRYGPYSAYGNRMARFGHGGMNLNFLDSENNFTFGRNKKKEFSLSAPPKLSRGCPKPLVFISGDSRDRRAYIILSTSMYHSGYRYHSTYTSNKLVTNEGCLYKYDLFNDSWDKYRKYRNNTFQPYNHGHAINNETNELYIFGGIHKTFALFNLDRPQAEKIYDITKHNDMTYSWPTSLFIRNVLHIFAEIEHKSIHSEYFPSKLQISKHFPIDEKSELNEEVDTYPNFYCCKVIYVKHLKQILMFNGYDSNTNIWCYSLITKKWKLFEIENGHKIYLPKQNTNNFDVTLIHDKIILICYNESKEIWCFNLDKKTSTNKWSRKNCKNFNGINNNCHMVNIDSSYIHFINTISPQHYMVWVYHLLGRRIIKRLYSVMLVAHVLRNIGFEKLTDKKYSKPTNVIVKLIADHCANVFY